MIRPRRSPQLPVYGDLPPEHATTLSTRATAVLGRMHQLAGAVSEGLNPEPVLRRALAAVVGAAP